MPQLISNRRTVPAAAVALLLLATLALTACGGSSKGPSASAAATRTSTTGRDGRFAALRECLLKNGITLPQRSAGQRPQPGRGGLQLPRGVTQAQFQAALKKCRGGAGGLLGGGGSANPSNTKALAKFASCMRQNGVNLPTPNTSGNGPVFNTKGIDTSSAKFKAARSKCQNDLRGTFAGRAGGGTPPPGAANGVPPGAGGVPPGGP